MAAAATGLVELDLDQPFWERFFTVAPLVVIGTREENGADDLAPKHMVTPPGWQNHFGFVCTRLHHTYGNALREGAFTVSFPTPEGLLGATLSASPRDLQGDKPVTMALGTFPAERVAGALLTDAYLYLECRLERTVDGLGENSLVIGRIELARVRQNYLRQSELDPQQQLLENPLLAYVHPGRFAVVEKTYAFPFPSGFER